LNDPTLALAKVDFETSVIEAVHSIAVRANEIEVGVQLAGVDPYFPLAARAFSQHGLTFVLTCHPIGHVVVEDRGPCGSSPDGFWIVAGLHQGAMCIRIHSLPCDVEAHVSIYT
jgi:hypothetical protein